MTVIVLLASLLPAIRQAVVPGMKPGADFFVRLPDPDKLRQTVRIVQPNIELPVTIVNVNCVNLKEKRKRSRPNKNQFDLNELCILFKLTEGLSVYPGGWTGGPGRHPNTWRAEMLDLPAT
ncbi:MAG: hypothetical protein JO366_01730, partial [Methylobacteriaceae bacterium]|nr:hypothetical protein [Methylobacteriaceae bacterium]MBV9243513.1 hypothetical protein [Methylobacteriaceae bacterium]